jgi:hypothetical protein
LSLPAPACHVTLPPYKTLTRCPAHPSRAVARHRVMASTTMALFEAALASELLDPVVVNAATTSCPISGEQLTPSSTITLACEHKFSVTAIYAEVFQQKKHPPPTEAQKLWRNQLKCPLCRNVQSGLLPPHAACPPVIGVNAPRRLCFFPDKCQHVFMHGKRVGQTCAQGSLGEHCNTHAHIKPMSERVFCDHVMVRGARKGLPCGARALHGSRCGRHKVKA